MNAGGKDLGDSFGEKPHLVSSVSFDALYIYTHTPSKMIYCAYLLTIQMLLVFVSWLCRLYTLALIIHVPPETVSQTPHSSGIYRGLKGEEAAMFHLFPGFGDVRSSCRLPPRTQYGARLTPHSMNYLCVQDNSVGGLGPFSLCICVTSWAWGQEASGRSFDLLLAATFMDPFDLTNKQQISLLGTMV